MCLKSSGVEPVENQVRAALVLEDGSRFAGLAFGAHRSVAGEVGKKGIHGWQPSLSG